MDIGVNSVKIVTTKARSTDQELGVAATDARAQASSDGASPVTDALVASQVAADDLSSIVASIQDAAQAIRRDLSFSLDKEADGVVVVKVMDSNGDLIRQIPSEEILRLRGQMEDARSLLLSTTA
ncbi:flagellar protein FlaG [Pseudomonas sp. PDM11]|uniref:flagellar protein FlaG n=1 Tax=Pseudomonas sp. PDM11 TaxID=2769309 RepID=UPI001780D220|nr:flagellar protein FlaG [Pseudomonas sp. PDM11]MBD9398220.1 flagellar protein FlaG [Pseudomonas sp. PDM11]